MTISCLKCNEVWDSNAVICECCGSDQVNINSKLPITLRYVYRNARRVEVSEGSPKCTMYDVVRISTGKSVFYENNNYIYKNYREGRCYGGMGGAAAG
jgi:hypothetical protein